MIPQASLQKFRESLRGQSFCPGEAGYDATRTVPDKLQRGTCLAGLSYYNKPFRAVSLCGGQADEVHARGELARIQVE